MKKLAIAKILFTSLQYFTILTDLRLSQLHARILPHVFFYLKKVTTSSILMNTEVTAIAVTVRNLSSTLIGRLIRQHLSRSLGHSATVSDRLLSSTRN